MDSLAPEGEGDAAAAEGERGGQARGRASGRRRPAASPPPSSPPPSSPPPSSPPPSSPPPSSPPTTRGGGARPVGGPGGLIDAGRKRRPTGWSSWRPTSSAAWRPTRPPAGSPVAGIAGIFDRPSDTVGESTSYTNAETIGFGSSGPRFTCRSADLPGGADDGDVVSIVVDGEAMGDFVVRVVETDGTGMSVLVLEV